MQPVLQPVPIFRRSLGDKCPRENCRRVLSVTRVEDFEILSCSCSYSCKQQSGEMKLAYAQQVFERTAQRRSQS